MTVRALHADEADTFMALRARLATVAPWLNAATFAAVPVAVDDPDHTIDCDRWGRLYVNYDRVDDPAAAAAAISDALGTWLEGTTTPADHHLSPDDADIATAQANLDLLARRVAAAAASASSCELGTFDWSGWADQVRGVTAPRWDTVVAGAIRRVTAHRRGAVDYTWTRPGRRQIPGILTPARVAPSATVTVIADISGSVTDHLEVICTKITRLAAAAGIDRDRVVVIAVDDEVAWTAPVRTMGPLVPRAGHGTDLRAGFDAALGGRRPDLIVAITDGETPWPANRPGVPTVVCLAGSTERRRRSTATIPDWATVVTVDTAPAERT